MSVKKYAVLTCPKSHISFLLDRKKNTIIGRFPGCHIIVNNDEIAEKHVLLRCSLEQWELILLEKESVQVNHEWIELETTVHPIFHGDVISIGQTDFVFHSLMEDSSSYTVATPEKERLNSSEPSIHWEVRPEVSAKSATETFRIVKPSPNPKGLPSRPVIVLVLFLTTSLTCLLTMGKLEKYRSYFNAVEEKKNLSKKNPIFLSNSPFYKPGEATWVRLNGFSLLKVPAISSSFAKHQEEIFRKFEEGEYEQAEALYAQCIYQKMEEEFNSFENILKYNGWLFRWLAMLENAHEKPQELVVLESEHKLVSEQVQRYIKNPQSKKHYQELLDKIQSKILQLQERK